LNQTAASLRFRSKNGFVDTKPSFEVIDVPFTVDLLKNIAVMNGFAVQRIGVLSDSKTL